MSWQNNMKALKRISEKPNDMVLMDLPEPRLPGDDWLKVKVSYAGICGSDIKMFHMDCSVPDSKLRPPVIPGHEFSGLCGKRAVPFTMWKLVTELSVIRW